MFCIKLAGIPIGVHNRYPFIQDQCTEYLTDEAPVFTVSASDEELDQQQSEDRRAPLWYCESLCIYRNICLELPRYDAFLMHSAVVAVDGQAYVFAAQSGVGKTTHIKLWLDQFGDRAQVVNGDKPIFRFIENKLYACGTPWMGKERMGSNILCPVAGICFLERGDINEIQPLPLPEVSRRIFHQLLLPKDHESFECFWRVLDRLLVSAPFYLMRCNREPDAALAAYQMMRRSTL